YLERRYASRSVRLFGTFLGICHYAVYIGIVLFGPGIALQAVTDFPLWASILVVAIAAIIYTSLGGIKAVIWTDVFQSLVMFLGIFAILIKGTMVAGGPSKVWNINANSGRLKLFDFDPDPTIRHTFWSLLIGSTLRGIGLTFNQSTVQRISSTQSMKEATTVMLIVGPAFFITLSLTSIEGLVAYAYYHTIGCDPLASKQIKNPNQIVPFMVMDIFREAPGMPGLFMASVMSASLSTLSSGLSSLSALTWEDIIKPHVKFVNERKATLIAKSLVVFYGLLAIGIAFLIETIGGPLSQISMSLLSSFQGPLAGIFLLSAFIPRATQTGAISGGIIGVTLVLWISLGQNFSPTIKKTPWLQPAPIDQCYEDGLNSTFNNFTQISTFYSRLTTTVSPVSISTLNTKEDTLNYNLRSGLDKLYSMSYQWFGALGCIVTVVMGISVSYATGAADPSKVDERYILPFFDQLFCCLPEKLRKRLRFGIDYQKKRSETIDVYKGYEVPIDNPEVMPSLEKHDTINTNSGSEYPVMSLLPNSEETTSNYDQETKNV
ncbi:hypothetical protein ScPMuIL_018112, partial [Solemya velum]